MEKTVADKKSDLNTFHSELTINMVGVQNSFPATIVKIGQISGQRYTWKNAGDIVSVDSRDVPELLAYKIGGSNCCGGAPLEGFQVFQIVN